MLTSGRTGVPDNVAGEFPLLSVQDHLKKQNEMKQCLSNAYLMYLLCSGVKVVKCTACIYYKAFLLCCLLSITEQTTLRQRRDGEAN